VCCIAHRSQSMITLPPNGSSYRGQRTTRV
jgi:hypothetical protein